MKTAYIHGIILDGTEDMKPYRGCILTQDDMIEDIIPETITPEGYQIVDLKDAYIMPGLINLHVHLPSTGKPKKKEMDPVKLVQFATSNAITRKYLDAVCAKSAKTQLMSGVTTLRTVGGVEDTDAKIRDDILKGKRVGPRILSSNMAVSVPHGHMADSLAYAAKSPEEAVSYVEKIAQGKPDLIKLMITGGVLDATKKGEPGVVKMKPEIVKAACQKAHELGYPVAAHVESSEGVRVALMNGVDTIEHGAKPDDEILKLFKEKKAALVATLSPAMPFALFDREISHASEMAQYNGKIVFEGIIECAKACLENKIPVGLGTDTGCPFITHYDMWREIYYFSKYCHVSPAFALHTATLVNAKIIGIDSMTGSIEKGKCADFLITKENPLENLQALRSPHMVVARGQIFSHPKIHKMENVERVLDTYL